MAFIEMIAGKFLEHSKKRADGIDLPNNNTTPQNPEKSMDTKNAEKEFSQDINILKEGIITNYLTDNRLFLPSAEDKIKKAIEKVCHQEEKSATVKKLEKINNLLSIFAGYRARLFSIQSKEEQSKITRDLEKTLERILNLLDLDSELNKKDKN